MTEANSTVDPAAVPIRSKEVIEGEPIKNIRLKAASGVRWSVIAQVLRQVFTFCISVILARILGPNAYGLIAMILVFANFALLIGDLALGPAVIQRKLLEPKHLNAAFWVTIGMGAVLCGVMAACAPLIALFYREPLLAPLAAVLSFKFLLVSGNVVQKALLSREMRFRQLAVIEISGVVVGGVLGIAMAYRGLGVWSLVAQNLAAAFVSLLLAWAGSKWRPEFSLEIEALKDLWRFGGYYLSFNLVNYWSRNLDNLLVGRFIGATALAVYSRAYSLMLLPLTQVAQVLGKVMFPALSAIQGDHARVKRAYLKATAVIALITFPMMVGLHTLADQFIATLLGSKWLETIPLLKIFCWIGLLQSVTSPLGWITTSQGRTKLYFWVGLVNAVFCAVGFAIGLRWGVTGVAVSYLICNLVMWYPTWSLSGRVVDLGFLTMAKSYIGVFACSLGMGVAIQGLEVFLAPGVSNAMQLLLLVPSGVLIYLGLIHTFKLEAWRIASAEFAGMWKRRTSKPD